MDIKDMSAEQRKEELARLADAVKAAKAETKTAKTRVAEGKDAVKGAKTAEEKAALKESLAALEAACQAATAKVAEAVAVRTLSRTSMSGGFKRFPAWYSISRRICT